METGVNANVHGKMHKRANILLASIHLLRPKQWIKNLFVFAGIIFSHNVLNLEDFFKALAAFFLFCGVSSCVYIINDILDIDKDKIHPVKKFRPLPSGQIKTWQALFIFFGLLSVCMFLSIITSISFTCVILAYLIINLAYSYKLKHLVILDIMIIAAGFVLRAISGALVINVVISPWLLICTAFLALFLGLNKRKNELLLLEDTAEIHRKNLSSYSIPMINEMLPTVTSCAIISYALYTFTAAKSTAMMATIPFVLYGIFRYQYLTSKKGMGGSPELVLFKDPPIVINILLWGLTTIFIEYCL